MKKTFFSKLAISSITSILIITLFTVQVSAATLYSFIQTFNQLNNNGTITERNISTYCPTDGKLQVVLKNKLNSYKLYMHYLGDSSPTSVVAEAEPVSGVYVFDCPRNLPEGKYNFYYVLKYFTQPPLTPTTIYVFKFSQETIEVKYTKSNTVNATGINLSKKSYTLKPGVSVQLKAKLTPSNSTNTSLSWKSSNTKVAVVNASGNVTAVGNGTAYITVSTDNGKTDKCKVEVKTPAASIKLKKTSISLKKGKTQKLIVSKYTPSNVYPKTIIWRIKNKNIATVNSKGIVKGIKPGTTYIYAKTWNGKTAKCKIIVR